MFGSIRVCVPVIFFFFFFVCFLSFHQCMLCL